MIAKDRISRRDRQGKTLRIKGLIVVALVVSLTGLALYKIKRPAPPKPVPVPVVEAVVPPNIWVLSDSLIEECYRSFGLSDSVHVDSVLGQRPGTSGKPFRRYNQGWPRELPLILFAQRLTEMSSERGANCDCLESSKDDWLECSLMAGGVTGGRIRLMADRQTKLAGRELAMVFDNLGAIKKDDLTRLIRAGYTFGYLATLDLKIADDMRKLFARANITPILSLPAGEEGWRKLAQDHRLLKGTGKKKRPSAFHFESEMVAEVIARQKGARAFTLDLSGGSDPDILKAVMEEAKRAKLTYILNRGTSLPLDSLAISKGLTVLRLDLEPVSSPQTMAELKLTIFGPLIGLNGQLQRGLYFDGAQVDVDKLMEIKEILNRLGIRIRPCLKLARPVELS